MRWHAGSMSQVNKVTLLLGVFFLGCAAERLIVPPARAGTTPQRWEYACKDESGDKDVTKMANAFAQQGWELVGAGTRRGIGNGDDPTWCFKRSLP
jgi:hypothetical protein